MKKLILGYLLLCNISLFAQTKIPRIVSISGAVTEILVGLGLQNQIVGTDVTSNYPASIEKLPKVGHNRGIGAEATLALQPTIVIGTKDEKGTSFLKMFIFLIFQQKVIKTFGKIKIFISSKILKEKDIFL